MAEDNDASQTDLSVEAFIGRYATHVGFTVAYGYDKLAEAAKTPEGRDAVKKAFEKYNQNSNKGNSQDNSSSDQNQTTVEDKNKGKAAEGSDKSNEDALKKHENDNPKEVKIESEKTIEEQKLASDFKKLYGVDYTPANVQQLVSFENAEKALTAKDATKNLKGYSTEDLAKLQFAVRQAEFDAKYKEEPDKAIADRRQNIIANKDKMNDAILDKMEGYASGTKKIQGKDYESYKSEKDSFNVLRENAPEELQKHCKGTLEKADRKINGPKGAVSQERLSKAETKKLKYESIEINDSDGLWIRAKKAARKGSFDASRTAKKKIRKWWRKGKLGKFVRGIADNKVTRGISKRYTKAKNRVKLFPSRAKKAVKNRFNKFKKWFGNTKVGNFLKKTRDGINKGINKVKTGYKKTIQWAKDHPKTAMAIGAMLAATGMGAAAGAAIGSVGVLAGTAMGAQIGGMAVAGATAAYWTYQGAQWTYGKAVKVKNDVRDNLKENLKEFVNNGKESRTAELDYLKGRQVFNERPDEMKALVDNYKKAITPEGNEGKPLTEKEAAVKMYQTMIGEKDKGGLGLDKESAQSVMTYFNGNKTVASKFEDIKDEINKPQTQKTGQIEERTEESKDTTKTNETKERGEGGPTKLQEQSQAQTEARQQGRENPSKKKEVPARAKVSEDVLVQGLSPEQKAKYNQAKGQYKAVVDRFGPKSNQAKQAAKVFEEKLFGTRKPEKDKDGNMIDKNIGLDKDTARAFKETLGRTGAVPSFKGSKQGQQVIQNAAQQNKDMNLAVQKKVANRKQND